MRDKLLRILRGVAVTAFWLAVWAGGCYLANRQLFLPLPYPWDVLKTLWQLMGQTTFWLVVGTSLLRVAVGFVLALIAGIVLAREIAAHSLACDTPLPAGGGIHRIWFCVEGGGCRRDFMLAQSIHRLSHCCRQELGRDS